MSGIWPVCDPVHGRHAVGFVVHYIVRVLVRRNVVCRDVVRTGARHRYCTLYTRSLARLLVRFLPADGEREGAFEIGKELVRPNIRSTAIATYLLTTGLGGISAVIVAAINVSLGFKAPFQPADGHTTTYDPTYGLLLMVPCMYALSCVGYGLTALAMRITLKRDDVY